MIALAPRDIVRAGGLLAVLHLADKIVAGITAWQAGLIHL
jgi:hypothetical protein